MNSWTRFACQPKRPIAYDLNDPEDARIFCAIWVHSGRITLEPEGTDVMMLSDAQVLDLAQYLFVNADDGSRSRLEQ